MHSSPPPSANAGAKWRPRRSTTPRPLRDAFVARAVDYLSAHAAGPISVEDVVTACGTSRRFLEIRFKALTGRTLLEAIHDKRLGAVVDRLRETDEPLGVLSDRLGFRNPSSLCALFRRRFGRSMHEYRAELRAIPVEEIENPGVTIPRSR